MNEKFFDAVESGRIVEVRKFLQDGHPPTVNYMLNLETPLTIACMKGDKMMVNLLLEYGADVNFTNRQNESPLISACDYSRLDIIKLLLKNPKTDINMPDAYGTTPLMLGVVQDEIQIVRILLQDSRLDINLQNQHGITALMFAANKGYDKIVRLILYEQRDVRQDLESNNGNTALLLAIMTGQLPVVKLLLHHSGMSDRIINHQNHEGETALMIAIMQGHNQIADLLLRHNADIMRHDAAALRYAAENCTTTQVLKKLLLEYGQNLSQIHRQEAFLYAIDKGCLENVQVFARYRVIHPNECIIEGVNALMLAVHRNNKQIIDILLKWPRIDTSMIDGRGRTAFMIACWKGTPSIVRSFLPFELHLGHQDKNGRTALHYAVLNHPDIVRILLSHPDIDITIKNKEGKIAEDYIVNPLIKKIFDEYRRRHRLIQWRRQASLQKQKRTDIIHVSPRLKDIRQQIKKMNLDMFHQLIDHLPGNRAHNKKMLKIKSNLK
jgi:ankyrin repeat protein